MKEVAELQRGDLSGIGIHAWFDDTNIRRGKAMLIGPEGTPYAACPLVFDIHIPVEYPLAPPHVTIATSDGITRFHPNLYTNGKVCLSILGTFPGPSWVSTLNIESVLKSIYSLLNDNPITNEPGWERYTLADPKAKGFADFVQYRLIQHTIGEYGKLRAGGGKPDAAESLWAPFYDVINGHWHKTGLQTLRQLVLTRRSELPKQYASLPYGMEGKADWDALAIKIEALEGRALEVA